MSNIGLPKAKKDAQSNSSLVPRSNTMVIVAIIILETLSNGLYAF